VQKGCQVPWFFVNGATLWLFGLWCFLKFNSLVIRPT
jgi:hypothetical protein